MPERMNRGNSAVQRGVQSLVGAYDSLISSLGALVALGLLLMPVLIAVDVLLRNTSIGGIKWSADICEYILFVSTYLGAPWLLRLGLHVRVDIVVQSLPKRFARRFEQFLDLSGVIVCGIMTYYGGLAAIDAYRLGLKQYKSFTVADWPFHVVFTLSMALLVLEFVRRLPRPEEALEAKDVIVGV